VTGEALNTDWYVFRHRLCGEAPARRRAGCPTRLHGRSRTRTRRTGCPD